jgi:adenosylcobyric acid synthase
MGRSTVVQAEAAGISPSVLMKPVLLKPTTDMSSQVIVNGEVLGNMEAGDYFSGRRSFMPEALAAYEKLAAKYELIVLEGAGSPAEINLRDRDIVNMGMAKKVGAPVLLAGDIDRGGVFAQLYGTVALLDDEERSHVKGLVINKFRGDLEILKPGLSMLEEKAGLPVLGVVPWLDVNIEEEDNPKAAAAKAAKMKGSVYDACVISLPHISNFTDFYALEAGASIRVRYVRDAADVGNPDLLLIPGTKNTIGDLQWMRNRGLDAEIERVAQSGSIVFGVCGGYQMLGVKITDKEGVEIKGGASVPGLGLLPLETDFFPEKQRKHTAGHCRMFGGCDISGYEIHMGLTRPASGSSAGEACDPAQLVVQNGNVYGSYVHGLFDTVSARRALSAYLAEKKGTTESVAMQDAVFDLKKYKEGQFDKLAAAVRAALDMEKVYSIVEKGL